MVYCIIVSQQKNDCNKNFDVLRVPSRKNAKHEPERAYRFTIPAFASLDALHIRSIAATFSSQVFFLASAR
jgi:hypothetical protein